MALAGVRPFARLRWPRACTTSRMTTIGQLIEALFTKYERELHDHEQAAVATKRALDGILRARRRR